MRNQAWANFIREARMAKEWHQKDLAANAKLDPSYITLIERDGYVPRKDKVLDLARALELEPDRALLIAGFAPEGISVAELLEALTVLRKNGRGKKHKRLGILSEIDREREHQDRLHPTPYPNLDRAFVVLGEEVGEVARAIEKGLVDEARAELVQVAAVAVRAIEVLF